MVRMVLLVVLVAVLEGCLFVGWMARRLDAVWGRMDTLERSVKGWQESWTQPVDGEVP